ncbi:MAG TPA: DUF433 domain-containing protein [Armatimonadota bacterium]|nr:DUF433 domain-containing protein [Armatimonadota bacterium]
MPVVTDHDGVAMTPHAAPTGGDPYIRLGEILRLRRTHLPQKELRLKAEPESIDDCRIVAQAETTQYHFRGTPRWLAYVDVEEWRDHRRSQLSHTRPPTREDVFAPVKIVLAEHDWPIRAVLSYEAICPTRAKMGILGPGSSLWLAYAALAVLNSAVGQGLYREMLEEQEGRSRTPSGLSMSVLRQMPVAARNAPEGQLARVAHAAHQVTALYEAQEECRADFRNLIIATRERLLGEVCALLSLSEEHARNLIESVRPLPLDDHPGPDPQLMLFGETRDIPPVPPIKFLDEEERRSLERLRRQHKNGGIPSGDEGNWTRLRNLRLWEERLATRPPKYLEQANDREAEDEPFPIENLLGVHLPVKLVHETISGESYEYYPLGEYIVAAPGVCGGRAIFKKTRIDVRHILADLTNGRSEAEISSAFGGRIPLAALKEARILAAQNDPEVFEKRLVPAGRE